MAGLCNLALHQAINKTIKDAPYMKYDKESNFVEISLGGKLTEYNIHAKAIDLAETLNTAINNGVKNIGKVFEPTSKEEIVQGVRVRITQKQLALLDSDDEQTTLELQKEVDEENAKREQEERNREIEGEEQFFQKEEIEQSKASVETINKISEAAKQMGINIVDLAKYSKEAKLDIKGINGLADVIRRVVAIAHGKEGEALIEEVVHIATAMLEQINPKLITELISKIDRFKIYKQVLDLYKNDKNYQLENGKPDIRKIKKEAVDKLIAEVIINNSENEEQFPELREETNRNIIQKWWETIKDYIRGVYRKSNIDIFEEVGKQILEGKVVTPIKEGIDFIFEQTPELTSIGTQQQYSQYLENLGITNIAYHHSEEDISEFTSSSERYFQRELKKKNKYIPKLDDIVFLVKKPLTEEFMSKRKFIGSWGLKTPKTLQFNAGEKIGEGVHPGIDEGIFAAIQGNYDAVDFGRIRDNKTWSEVIAITNPNNAVRLGSKQDIEGFRDFVKNNKSQQKQLEKGIYYQIKNDKVDAIYDVIMDKDSRLQLNPESVNDKRHYTFDGERVAKSVTEKIKEHQNMPERTPEQKKMDDVKKDWGIEGHRFLEEYISLNLIDKDGYIRETPLTNNIDTPLNEGQQTAISDFAKSLVYSYKKGTRILVEIKVVNERVKGKLASTMDFLAIEPQENGEAKVDVLDWKFIDIDKNKTEDVPWFKEKEWKAQMGEYAKILYNYGIKYGQLRKQRMIPFIMNYEYSIKGKKDSSLVPTSIEVGDINNPKDTKMYLLSVPLNTESTGNTLVDILLNQLRTQWEKIYSKPVGPEERAKKDLELNQLRKAIRSLHLQMNFEPLVSVGETFLKNADELFKSFENIDYTKLSKEDIQNRLGILLEYRKSADKFASLDEVYLSHVSKDNMTPEEKKVFIRLEKISASTERMFSKIEAIQKDFVVQLALKEEVTTEANKMSILDAEKAIDSLSKTFLEASFLSPRIIQLATNLILKAQSLVNRKISKKLDEYKSVILPLEQEAKAKGKKAFELIGRTTPSGLKLIQKVDRGFWESIKQAKKDKNKDFFLSNMDVEKYNSMASEAIERGIVVLNNTTFSTDEEQDNKEREFRIIKLKDSLDINRSTFNGYDGWQFGFIFNKVVDLEGHYSKEYLEMSDNAKRVWEFFTALNERARQMGYIDKQGMSFFPLIEATTLDKLSQTSNIGSELKDIGNDFFKMKINEEQIYSKIDPETGQVKKVIPKYFTRTDKAVEQLSTDLLMVGSLWVKSLYEYENAKEMENVLLTLHSVESSKGSLMVDSDKKVIMEAGVPKVNKTENKNADVLQTIVDDYLYDLSEDASSLGNIGISEVAGKLTKDAEEKSKAVVSTKKLLKHSDVLVRVLGVGLKPLIAMANYAGGQFQAFITAGNMYRFRDFERNNAKITTGVGLSTEEKALLHAIIPLNEDVAIEKRREIAKGKSLIEFLKTFSFQDVMMITNSFPERRLQYANAMSFNENSMVVDGKIVNIRQWVKEQDRRKYKLSELERREIEKTYEERVQELKDTKSLVKIARIENDQLVLDGVSEEELAKYRVKVIEYNRQLNGQMSDENKAGYRRDTILRSFMMFKTWIPKLLTARVIDIHKNLELDEWQYGRTRVFVKTWAHLGITGITKMRDIIMGTEEGLKIMDEMFEQKKHEYFLKTGKQLEITQEEFYDLVRKTLSEEMKELGLLFSLMGVLIAAKAAQPPEDASDYEKNQYKFWAKALNKISDEVSFYYNPLSFSQITQGNVLPSLNLLVKAEQAIMALGKETTGYIIDDEDMVKKAYPVKYFLNVIPGASQFNSEVLPYIWPEAAKELGIRVSSQSRPK